jgi:DNA-binding NarL/FixJ family response regulator
MSEDASRVGLTLREREVVRLVAEGYTYWEITDTLAVGSGFVRACVDCIYWKLQLRWGDPEPRDFEELLIDCEEDRILRAALVGMLREADRGR